MPQGVATVFFTPSGKNTVATLYGFSGSSEREKGYLKNICLVSGSLYGAAAGRITVSDTVFNRKSRLQREAAGRIGYPTFHAKAV